jgi:mannose-6-phosphate isomerase
LAPLFPQKSNLAEPLGEAWLTGVDCKIATGVFAGKTLGVAWHEMPPEWRGLDLKSVEEFPLLVKFIFPTDKLSIQVHPDDAYASVHEKAVGGRGKTEMWHIVSAELGAQLLAGLKPGVTKEKFLESLAAHTLEDLFQAHLVHAGDTFFIPAGTPHTIGASMVVFEVQEYSDLTYRVYDYDRVDAHGKPRELHVEKALAVTEFSGKSRATLKPLQWPCAELKNSLLAACPYFATERWEVRDAIPVHRDAIRFHLLVFLMGTGKLQWENGEMEYRPGECWLIPSALDGYRLLPMVETSLIRTYVPDLNAVRESLRRLGIAESRISEVVFE